MSSMYRTVTSIFAVVLFTPAVARAEGRFIVKLKDPALGRAAVLATGGTIALELLPQQALATLLPQEAVEALTRNPHIEYLEPDPERYPLAQTTPYGIPMVEAPQVWASAGGAGRKVCVIDSGYGLGHDDLQSQGVTGYPSGWNTDLCGHGTHVTGTIAALDNTRGVVGVLPSGVALHVVKVFGDDCSWTYSSTLIDALNRCTASGAHVVSMSLGGGFKSRTEEAAFKNAYAAGVLPVAAAGNNGSTQNSYPASYESVVSVGAVDLSKQLASFSQRNGQVELVAPGVEVVSTVPWLEENTLSVGGVTYLGNHLEGAARTSGTSGALADGGSCTEAGVWSGKIVLCVRGNISFNDKVTNVKAGGGVAAIVYNNAEGNFFGTLGDGISSSIAAISLSQSDGQALVWSQLGANGTVVSQFEQPGSGYEAWSGTSMATPHVSAVAALIWSKDPSWSNAQVRAALRATAEDLGPAGRDDGYGYGLVRAKAALDYLMGGAGGGGGPPPNEGFLLRATGGKVRSMKYADLSWSGSAAQAIDVYRDGALIATTANDGEHTDALGRRASSLAYQLCEAGTTTCSNTVIVVF